MYRQFFAGMEWTALPLFALGLFLVMFVLMLLRTFAWKSKGDFAQQENLPLSDGRAVSTDREVTP
ncbi:MAG: CcoQ/FixQ family Cbb3-type cytochrome c oxidase assembly chaperone [Myxococcota bacterium]